MSTEPASAIAGATIRVCDLHTLPPTVDVEMAAGLLGIGRALAYRLVRQNAFPCRVVRAGRRYRVATTDLLRTLGVDEQTGRPSDARPTEGASGTPNPSHPASDPWLPGSVDDPICRRLTSGSTDKRRTNDQGPDHRNR
jgi:hypothetical protein